MVRHHTFHYSSAFALESGGQLPGFQLHYTLAGQLNEDASNVVWVVHALTGGSDFSLWWDGLIGKGKTFDPKNYLIIGVNSLGSCYGSTGPLSINPLSGQPFYHSFPFITQRDIVRSFDVLREHLGIQQIHTLIGGSLGGQQALEWAIEQPQLFQHLIVLATNAQHSPYGIAYNESQRMAIALDPSWKENHPLAGIQGMKVARSIGLLSYRSYQTYRKQQSESDEEIIDGYRASSYQQYQGEKLSQRFNAFSYWVLSKTMDAHHVGRGRGSVAQALSRIQAKTLVIGIDSDQLFPLREQILLSQYIPHSKLETIHSPYGHDGFLIETEKIGKSIHQYYSQQKKPLNTLTL